MGKSLKVKMSNEISSNARRPDVKWLSDNIANVRKARRKVKLF